eukprot:CAMPEP_0170156366 /NCGR_PEP_ID=MMETSP0033_2-20121228/62953_1 /TAXON_ID=195969 /ORGANISM="Dolichomastix tenuilepis, Strain CCMP3274" /LENGTH=335 /DNA_ID=CAMNT_0010393717 /DNA_START=37 /DNA_END=1044 /DNA_ORIENTATION=+
MSTPLLIVAGALLMLGVMVARREGDSWRRALNIFLVQFNAWYFKGLVTIFAALSCTEIDSTTGQRFLAQAPWRLCEDENYKPYMLFAAACVMLYGFGYPLCSYLLVRHLSRQDRLDDEHDIKAFGFLYNAFKREKCHYGLVVLFRRAIIAALVTVYAFTNTNLFTILLGMYIVLQLSLALQLYHSPYKHHIENLLEVVQLGTLVFITVATMYVHGTQAVQSYGPSNEALTGVEIASSLSLAVLGVAACSQKLVENQEKLAKVAAKAEQKVGTLLASVRRRERTDSAGSAEADAGVRRSGGGGGRTPRGETVELRESLLLDDALDPLTDHEDEQSA